MYVLVKKGKQFKLFDLKVLAVLSFVLIGLSAGAMALYRHVLIRIGTILIAIIIVLLNRGKISRILGEIGSK